MKKERAYRVEKKVLVELVRKIVKEVEGVYSIKKGMLGGGIRIKQPPEGVEIWLGLIIKRGVSIPAVVEEVQSKLKKEIEATLGISVKKIGIVIKKIKFSH